VKETCLQSQLSWDVDRGVWIWVAHIMSSAESRFYEKLMHRRKFILVKVIPKGLSSAVPLSPQRERRAVLSASPRHTRETALRGEQKNRQEGVWKAVL